jgi:hypothetical protein
LQQIRGEIEPCRGGIRVGGDHPAQHGLRRLNFAGQPQKRARFPAAATFPGSARNAVLAAVSGISMVAFGMEVSRKASARDRCCIESP